MTPYFASKLLIDQMPAFGGGRLGLSVYPGGHMFYSRPESRAAFHKDAADLYAAAIKSRASGDRGDVR